MDFLFYNFSCFGLLSGVMVVLSRNPVHSVFFLILVFCFSSCILLLLTVDFLAVIFIVVYVGAIAVLFLFVVMMLNIKLVELRESFVRHVPVVILIGFVFISQIVYIIVGNFWDFGVSFSAHSDWVHFIFGSESISLFGEMVYTHYAHAFIISGMILLVSMVGSISLTLFHSLDVRRQAVYKQVGRSSKKALRLLK